MTGFTGLAVNDHDENKKLVGEVRVKGPRWAKMPLLTVSMLGIQIVWSMEMAWGEAFVRSVLIRLG